MEGHLISLLYEYEANPTFRYFQFQSVLAAGDSLAAFEKSPLTLNYDLFVEKVDRIVVFDNELQMEEPKTLIPIAVLLDNEQGNRHTNATININNCSDFEDLEDTVKIQVEVEIAQDPTLEFRRIRYEHRGAIARHQSHGQEDIVLNLPTNWQEFKNFLELITIVMRRQH